MPSGGVIVLNQGNLARAKPYIHEAQAELGAMEDKSGLANALQCSGYVALLEGDVPEAKSLIQQAFMISLEAGPRWLLPLCLAGLAGVLAVQGQVEPAVRLWAAAESLIASVGSYMDNADRIYYQRTIEPALPTISGEALEAAHLEGGAMSMEQAIQYAMEFLH